MTSFTQIQPAAPAVGRQTDQLLHSASPEFLQPAQLAALLPASPVLSSRGMGWKGLIVEEYRFASPGELDLPPTTHHSLICRMGKPFLLLQERCGRVHEGLAMPDSFCLTPAGERNHIRWQDAAHTLHLRLEPEWVAKISSKEKDVRGGVEVFHSFGEIDTQVIHIALALKAELENGCYAGPLYAESLATALTVYLLKRFRIFPRTHQAERTGLSGADLNHVCEYIHTNLSAALTLADLADLVHLSPYHFTRQFKQCTGLPPHQYVIAQRVERAKGLLRAGGLTAGEVAYAVGFGNQGHLNFHFKRLLGITPCQYTRNCRGR